MFGKQKKSDKQLSAGKKKTKIGKSWVDNGETRIRATPFEDELQFESMVRIQLRGQRIGAYLLKKGENSFMLQFGFECQGIHTTLRTSQVDPIFDAIEAGLKDLPENERLTVNLGSFTSDAARQAELQSLCQNAPSSELQYLLIGERVKCRELTDMGIRKPKFLRLYGTYTVEPDTSQAADRVEKILGKIEGYWRKFTGEYNAIQFIRIEKLIYSAFTEGYQIWEQLLANKMGLDIRPYTEEELWAQLWQRFNDTPPIPIPQLLVLDEDGLREESYSETHPVTLLMESETSVPIADRRWVNVKSKYIGALTFVDKPGGWISKEAQLRYFWDNLIRREDVYDTEIFCQMMKANDALVKMNMQRIVKQSNVSAQLAKEQNSVDVASLLKVEDAVAAQADLYRGSVTIHTAVAFLVYRNSRTELDDACSTLQSLFLRPAWVLRETEYPWKIWLQTLPICWDRLLTTPFNRRLPYLSGEAPGFMSLVRTRSFDNSGFELIAAEGGTPVYLDLFNQHRNLGVLGTSRSGKSIIVSGMLTHGLARKMPVVALDYPKPDGTSTFTDYAGFLGEEAAYFDIGKECSNLFEIPDLSALESKLQQERFEDYKEFLASALMAMVVGKKRGDGGIDIALSETVRSILALALEEFFGDWQIRDRYAKAFVNGFGSLEWEGMPTLRDFLTYCSAERLVLDAISGDIQTALQLIKLRLRFWISSRVGKAISAPSTFRSDARLLVFALRNLSNDEDAAILSLSAYSAALRRALSAPASIFFIDESPILFEFDSVAALVGRLCANGAKAGIRVILSAQDPDSIAKSSNGAKIFQNLTTRLIGRIQPTAIDSFVKILKYPPEVIEINATESFFPKKAGMYSQWLLDDSGIYTFCRFYPAANLLASVANNPDEQLTRNQIVAAHADKFIGLTEYSKKFVVR